ncbi:MAG: phosphate-starvation-inducible E-like protein [Gammaproteobacteria bacterium TMED159]|jgi:protein PsiE|nr:MAG: phosphate-starvation-inducible E-like protein [Gammaproteobacteria bacterium TMED159]|tara:strand:+ start:380 stop:811 length:432 start_codon:yes stop_codon:yes gene_type:complete
MLEKLNDKSVNKGLHWTTIASEKALLAIIGISTCIAAALYLYDMILLREITLSDLFMLFIYAEILGMVGSFYSTSRIPVTLPIIIAITALCRLIMMQNKEMDALMIVGEASAVLILAGAAYLMSLKDKLSLEKLKLNEAKDNN